MSAVAVCLDLRYFFVLFTVVQIAVSQFLITTDPNITCSPASPLPRNSPSCRPRLPFNKYCQSRGIKLDSNVFASDASQKDADDDLLRFSKAVTLASHFFPIRQKCRDTVDMVYCHYYYPSCDTTGERMAKTWLCKETCNYLWHECKIEFKTALALNIKSFEENYPYRWDIFNCTDLPLRSAGHSPECWYWIGNSNQEVSKDECLYHNGSSYSGNISVTSSGIPCQAWTAQCPHRHTMNSTYPELNSADNYCRNPRGSGYRPWCFTSDKNKRWEYCNIPRCLPVHGNYSEWKLSSECNATCGSGVQVWRRSCDSPAPKYDGKNCTSKSIEYRPCKNLPACPVDGGYGPWKKNSTCNATCGEGFEQWVRTCDHPSPEYGGKDCSHLGKSMKWDFCKGLEVCEVIKRVGLLEKNAGKILIGSGGALFLVLLIVFGTFGYRKWQKIKMKEYEPYAVLDFQGFTSVSSPNGRADVEENSENSVKEGTSLVRSYENLNEHGEPISGVTRGITSYERLYSNSILSHTSQYSKLHIVSAIALDWMRNTWGRVDQLGKHVYDIFCPRPNSVLPYDRPHRDNPMPQNFGSTNLACTDDNRRFVYDKVERIPPRVPSVVVVKPQGVSDDVESTEDTFSEVIS